MQTYTSPRPPQLRGATRSTAAAARVLDANWLSSLIAVRRRVLLLICASVVLLAAGGWLMSLAQAAPGGLAASWPLWLAGAASALAGIGAFLVMVHVAHDLG
ncbi:MAG TPA: hypothetical protein VGE02_14310 [Gemmatimonadales bacterium]